MKETFGYTPEEYKKFCRHGMRYLILFSLLYMTLYCCRLNLANASAVMMRDLGFSKADIGILTSTLFWTYGIGQLINGRLSEIVGPIKFVIMSVVLSAGANIVFGLQHSLWAMAVVWAANGYFQSMAWTPGLATVTRWFPGRRRGFAMGFIGGFSGFGTGCVTLMVAWALSVMPQLGWKAAFLLPPAVPLLALIIFRLFAKESPAKIGLADYKEENEAAAEEEEEMKRIIREKGALYPYRYMLSNRLVIPWIFIGFMLGLVRYGLTTWIPLYFIDRFEIDITAGLLQSLALPVGMGFGAIVVPTLTDRLCPSNRTPAVIISGIAAALLISAFVFLKPLSTPEIVCIEVLLFLAGFCVYAVDGVMWTFAADAGGRVFAGTVSGIINFAAYMGAGVQSIVYGCLMNRLGWEFVFFSVAAFCLVMSLLAYIAKRAQDAAAA